MGTSGAKIPDQDNFTGVFILICGSRQQHQNTGARMVLPLFWVAVGP